MSYFIDMEKLRPDIYLTDEQKETMRSALRPPTFAERIKTWGLPSIICFLRCHASYFRMDSSPHCKNIQPIDFDQLAEVFDALANRLTEIITPADSAPSDNAKKGAAE